MTTGMNEESCVELQAALFVDMEKNYKRPKRQNIRPPAHCLALYVRKILCKLVNNA